MADIGVVLALVAFFGIAAAFVAACDKIVGASAAFEGESQEAAPDPAGPTTEAAP